MTYPAVTTLQSIITLAHQQYGIRFQLSSEQLVAFANMCQMIAYKQDLPAFEEWNQKLFLGQDVFGTRTSYTSPLEADLGEVVSGSTSGAIGTLLNYKTENRINKWIIEPTDGAGNFTLTAGETLTIPTGSSASLVVAEGQDYLTSNGPYRAPRESEGNPAFRKFLGITKVTDQQIFNSKKYYETDSLDYGLDLDSYSDRKMNVPYRWDENRKEVTLTPPETLEILQTDLGATSPATINDSNYRWVYYINPPTITNISQEDRVILPEEYRYEILYKGIEILADNATYGSKGSVRDLLAPNCARFWEDKGVQYQAFGDASDWISEG
ncbi:MAG: hypothetical protein GY861_12130 [bacterium]|nr:hypothetical protein [bacterium]